MRLKARSNSSSLVKAISAILAFTVFIVLSVFSQTATKESSSLKVAVDLVLLDVSVQGKDGQPVRNLEQNDFRVYEDKVEQRIASFSAEESPVTWGLVLDRSRSMQAVIKDVYQLALNVIDQGTMEDEMFIMTFNNKTELVAELTSDRRKLASSIFALQAEGNTALYDAVDSALDRVKQGKNRKKVLVVITDGFDNRSRVRYGHLVDRVKESDVLIYTVGLYGGMISNPTVARMISGPKLELQQLAELTGAYAHFLADSNKSREAIEQIARDVSEHYTIGYYPSNPSHDGGWRKTRVVVASQPNTKYFTRVRNGYYADKEK
jgi:Ca-activated chloride channel family protein